MKKTIFLTILLLLATVLATGVSALTEVVPIQRSGDVLELNELLGDVTETLDASDAPVALGTYHLSNGMGVTDVNTYLRLQWDWPPEYAQAKVVYDKDDDDNVGDFLWFEDGEEAFTFELEFANGLRSNISANGDLNDFIGLDLRIFGEFFTIMAANYQPATGLSMTLASPVKIVELEDADPAQVFSGNVVINSEAIEDADVDFYFNTNFGYFMLSKMRYRLYTDGIGGYEPYIAPGQGLRQWLDEPEGMFADDWDIEYEGFAPNSVSAIELQASGDDEYRLTFTNTQGVDYSNVRLAYVNSTGLYYGDDNDYLVFEQGTDPNVPAQYTIKKNDYFLLSHNGQMDTGVSRVLRLDSIDTSNQIVHLTDVGTGGSINAQYTGTFSICSANNPVTGVINVGGYAFDFWACGNLLPGKGNVQLLVDLDDDNVAGGESKIVVQGGGILDLGSQVVGQWKPALPGNDFTMQLRTLASRFDEATVDEVMDIHVIGFVGTQTITAEVVSQPAVGLDMNFEQSPSTTARGMTNYGVEVVMETFANDPYRLTINYPLSQMLPVVNVVFGTGVGPSPACSDGIDNDGDGLVDMNDPGCTGLMDNDEYNAPPVYACSDGLDNDGDGLVDMNDPGCSGPSDNDEYNPPPIYACNDGIDNDGDGLVDMNDPGCSGPSDDDERDGLTRTPEEPHHRVPLTWYPKFPTYVDDSGVKVIDPVGPVTKETAVKQPVVTESLTKESLVKETVVSQPVIKAPVARQQTSYAPVVKSTMYRTSKGTMAIKAVRLR